MLKLFPELFREIEDLRAYRQKLSTSAIYFAVTFIIVSYSAHAWSASNAWDFGYRPSFSYDGMDNLVATSGWTVKKVAWVYLAPPIWGIVVAVLGMIGHRAVDSRKTHLQTFLFWLSINGFLLYLSYVSTGILSGQNYSSKFFTGFAGFFGWLEWGQLKSTSLLIVLLIVSLSFALIYSKPVLQLNFSRYLATRKQGKLIIFVHIVFFPFLIGCLLVALSTFPMDLNYQVVRMATYLIVFLVILLGMNLHKAKHITIVKGGLKPLSPTVISILVVVLILSRFVLEMKIEPLW